MKRFILSILLWSFVAPVFANDWHDLLMKMEPTERVKAMGSLVRGRGNQCTEKKIFFQGFDDEKTVYWNVACSNGKDYVVSIEDDKDGTTRVVECIFIEALTKVKCFTKLK